MSFVLEHQLLEGSHHGRLVRGGHGLPKVSPSFGMPNPSTPCGWATPETALQPFQGWPALRAGSLRPSSTLLDTPRPTPMDLIEGLVGGDGTGEDGQEWIQCTVH
jgi:hypothetical protein